MSYDLRVDGNKVQCILDDEELILQRNDNDQDTLTISDIVGAEISINNETDEGSQTNTYIYAIKRHEDRRWSKTKIMVSGEEGVCRQLINDLQRKLNKVPQRPKKLLVFINPVSGNHNAEKIYEEQVSPVFKLAGINTTIIVSDREKHIEEAMSEYDYNSFDGIVICGGDGSVNQCFVPLLRKTQEDAGIDYNNPDVKFKPIQKPIGHIPAGTGNCFTRISAQGVVDVETTVLQIIKGSYKHLHVCNLYSGNRWRGCSAIVAGCGVSAEFFKYTEGFRWLKTLRYLVVPFYFYLMKHHVVYDADITFYKRKQNFNEEERTAETNESDESGLMTETDSISGNLMDVLVFNVDVGNPNYYFGSDDMDMTSVSTRVSMETSRFQLLKLFMNNMLLGRKEQPDFVRRCRCTGYKMKINEPKLRSGESYMLLLDGEPVSITDSEWEIRLQDPLVAFYSCP